MLAYILTEEVPPRDLDGPSANLALGDIISNVLPLDGKKDKLLGSDSNNVSAKKHSKFRILFRQKFQFLKSFVFVCVLCVCVLPTLRF